MHEFSVKIGGKVKLFRVSNNKGELVVLPSGEVVILGNNNKAKILTPEALAKFLDLSLAELVGSQG